MNSKEIRQAFFDFFKSKGHQVVPSSSLIPANDPTLLFTNAGMVQFKDTFLGHESRSYTRAVSAQRCLRAGGKHNDLENVGYTARHHTFFEMLGNFSFGDYFKREAIAFAWEFLTKVLKLAPEKLWITVYKDDDETADIWLNEIGVSASRFSRCGEKDNFWSMGDTGPCGPCTEIFYDHGPSIAGGPPGSATEDGDRYIEIWNLVFMQFNRDKEGHLHPLPMPSVDTGMGLERLAAVVQGVHNNYQTDAFQYLIESIAKKSALLNDLENPSLKVIADHIRATAFLIADGIIPGNEGRGYVLRRIIRRAIRHGHKLGLPMPFFHALVEPLIVLMGEAYPMLSAQKKHIEQILLLEEQQFQRTLENGLKILNEHMSQVKNNIIEGEVAFKLYDTYGFPVDLTADIAREHNFSVDIEGFNHCMQHQRTQSQMASTFQVDYSSSVKLDVTSTFKGYSCDELETDILAIIVDNQEVKHLSTNQAAAIVLRDTPFYPESGGQVGDKGVLVSQTGEFIVENTTRVGEIILHHGRIISGQIENHQKLTATVDSKRRNAIRLNHTATHLLHAALRKILGPHVQQKGSLVDSERARFDFSHFSPLTTDEIRQVELLVNAQIRANHPVETDLMAIEDAKDAGAVALFGEKYSEVVRVLTVSDFSKELCGGTHVNRTGDIGLFKIIAEYGVASGVRRIEMMTGSFAFDWVNQQLAQLDEIAIKLKTDPSKVILKLTQALNQQKIQEKELQALQQSLSAKSGHDLLKDVQQVGDINVLIKLVDNMDMQALRTLLDQLKSMLDKGIIVLYAITENKLNVVAGVSKALLGRAPAATILVQKLCGKGGGRDDMAQGGGALPDDLDARVAAIYALLRDL